MSKIRFMMLVFACSLGLFLASDGLAAIYKYVDRDGLINFADDIQSIPLQYRATASIVSGGANEDAMKGPAVQKTPQPASAPSDVKPGAPVAAVPAPQSSARPLEKPGLFSSKVVTSIIVVVSALFAFVILGIVDADHKKPIAIARVVILWGVSVYLLYAHTMDVVHLVGSIGTTVENAQQQAEEKGKKASAAMKKLTELVGQAGQANAADPGTQDPGKKE